MSMKKTVKAELEKAEKEKVTKPKKTERQSIMKPIEPPTPETEVNSETEVSTNTDAEVKVDLSTILKPKKKLGRKQVSVYLDEEVLEIYNAFGEQNPREKSRLVNKVLRQVFGLPEAD